MRNIMLAGFGVAFLWAGAHANADTNADMAQEGCTLEVAGGVSDAWMGDCENGKAHGKGVAILSNGTYSGNATDGRADGKGRLTYSGGGRYEGDWIRGRQHGRGSMVDADGDRYEGEFADGLPHGQGSGSTPGGGHHTGEWRHGEPVLEPEATDVAAATEMDAKAGTAETADSEPGSTAGAGRDCKLQMAGEILDWSGECRSGKAHGEGTATASDGSATYSGHAEGGRPHGFGTVTTAGGGYYQGGFRHGVHHGEATVRGPDGKLYRATFVGGEQSGDAVPLEGVATGDPWAEQADTGTIPSSDGTPGTNDDPWAQSDWEDPDPWGQNGTTAGPEAAGASVPDGHAGRRGTDEFDYNAALRTLDGADGMDRRTLPEEDDYTAKLRELERREAERRTAETAREAERQAEQLREEIAARQAAERRARHEAEEAGRRAALEREAEEAWQEPDDSYESYQSEPSDDSLFGGGEAGRRAFEEMLQRNIPSMGRQQAGDYSDRVGDRAPSDDGGYGDDCNLVQSGDSGYWEGADCPPEYFRVRRGTSGRRGSLQ